MKTDRGDTATKGSYKRLPPLLMPVYCLDMNTLLGADPKNAQYNPLHEGH